MSFEKPYAIVEFLEEDDDNTTAIVCSSWLIGRSQTYWPTVNHQQMLKLLVCRTAPDVDKSDAWPTFSCRVLGTASMFITLPFYIAFTLLLLHRIIAFLVIDL
jgi:hypothetical protein